jgi:hypothetical protein
MGGVWTEEVAVDAEKRTDDRSWVFIFINCVSSTTNNQQQKGDRC